MTTRPTTDGDTKWLAELDDALRHYSVNKRDCVLCADDKPMRHYPDCAFFHLRSRLSEQEVELERLRLPLELVLEVGADRQHIIDALTPTTQDREGSAPKTNAEVMAAMQVPVAVDDIQFVSEEAKAEFTAWLDREAASEAEGDR